MISKKHFLLLLILFPIFNSIMGQEHKITLILEINGKVVSLDNNFTVRYFKNDNSKEAKTTKNYFNLQEDMIRDSKINFTFRYKKYDLVFDSVPIRKDISEHKWKIVIDKKPFDKEKYWTIKEWKDIYIVYQLHNDNGTVVTISKTK